MSQRQMRGLCPGSGEKRILFNRDSGIRLCSQWQSISAGTSSTNATNGLRIIDSNMAQV